MAVRIRARRDTAANWTSSNPTLQNGEIGYETDTRKFKFGDGSTAWNSLGYATNVRRDTAANWTSGASTPKAGDLCVETDTGLFKFGDGSTAWGSLPYAQVPKTSKGTSNSSTITLNTALPRVGDSIRITNGANTALAMTIASGTFRLHLLVVTSSNTIDPSAGTVNLGRIVTSADSVLTITPPTGGYVQGYIERVA
jgi:hypothetical protein